ncbi:type I restriction modification DNA specificity domain protein [Peptostreptococcus anaerobius 653-L]|uniref:Type I restriction modification DNA specificity domain protein n=1 Tax=Peptostreptococcus anaerobius 653-L TaxID=596329 RepID=D3MSV3_9FIRM|nr:restriction endonuclease subunit S [Peptostreptococcus anaerobius]EFD04776.1 type I restriction modification DNA specificity domain protein [Peptostreptococcus anaerobius 653-L]
MNGKKKEERRVPKLRFPGFTEDWEQRKLGELGNVGMCKRIFKEQTFDEGDVPFFKIGTFGGEADAFISRELFEEYKKKYPYPEKGAILISASGTIGRTVEFTGRDEYFQDSNIVWLKHDSRLLDSFLKYVYECIKWNGIEGSTIKRLYNNNILKTEIRLPEINEQKQISTFFKFIDNLITLHQRKLEDLKEMKKGLLQKMFPKNNEKVPELRFPGFTEDWEQRKLGKLYQRNTERNENLIGYDKTISVATMSYKDDGNGASESSLSTYKVLRVGDIAFEGHTNKQFHFGRFVVNDIGTGIMSPRFSTLRPLNEMPVNFWKQYIHSESVMRRILVNSTKAGTMMNELVIPEFLNQTIMVPSENEQAVIGQYFTNLDHLITLHQRKLNHLKELKKGLLQQMFV